MAQVPDAVDRRLRSLRSDLVAAEEDLRSRHAQIELLRARVEELETIRGEILASDNGTPAPIPEQHNHQDEGDQCDKDDQAPPKRLLGATDAVIEYLGKVNGPVRPVTIVNALGDSIRTESRNRRNMLFNTVYALIKSGRVEKISNGRVKLASK